MTLKSRMKNIERKNKQPDVVADFLSSIPTEDLEVLLSVLSKLTQWQETGCKPEMTEDEERLLPVLEQCAEMVA